VRFTTYTPIIIGAVELSLLGGSSSGGRSSLLDRSGGDITYFRSSLVSLTIVASYFRFSISTRLRVVSLIATLSLSSSRRSIVSSLIKLLKDIIYLRLSRPSIYPELSVLGIPIRFYSSFYTSLPSP